jgi:long-subunit fatty acid transport protein
MTRGAHGFFAAVVVVASFAPHALASPGARSGFGSRAQALAGADVADARGATAVFVNPAALVQTLDTELSLGMSTTSYELTIDGRDAKLATVPTLDFGVVVPGSVITIPVAFGLDLSLPDGRFSKLHNADPALAYFPLDDSGPRLLDLGMALAVRPVAWLAVGGGVGFLAAAQGGFHGIGTAVAADGSGAEYESDLRHSVDADLVSVRYPIFGATVRPADAVTLGVGFRGSATIEQRVSGVLEGDVRIGGDDDTPPTFIPVRYSFETRARLAFLPAVLSVGGAVRPISGWRFGAQVDWEGWSAYPSPFARPDRRLEIDPPPGFPIMQTEEATLPKLAPLSDRFVPRVGVEKTFELTRALELTARVGYAYQAAVVPERQEQTLLVDLDRHVVALGAGGTWQRPFAPFAELRLDVHASLTAGVTQSIATQDVPGPPQTLGGFFGRANAPAEHRAEGHLVGAGATLTLAFDALGRSPELY